MSRTADVATGIYRVVALIDIDAVSLTKTTAPREGGRLFAEAKILSRGVQINSGHTDRQVETRLPLHRERLQFDRTVRAADNTLAPTPAPTVASAEAPA